MHTLPSHSPHPDPFLSGKAPYSFPEEPRRELDTIGIGSLIAEARVIVGMAQEHNRGMSQLFCNPMSFPDELASDASVLVGRQH